jgi:hypothetical protein
MSCQGAVVRKLVLAAFAIVLWAAGGALAQPTANSVNPEALEFETPVFDVPGVTGYRLEVFQAGTDPVRDSPVTMWNVPAGAAPREGRLRVELKDMLLEVPDGRYIAVIETVGVTPPRQSAPSTPFVLARGPVVDRLQAQKRERFWTRVSVAIGAGLLLAPLLAR